MFIEANWALKNQFLVGSTCNLDYRQPENKALLTQQLGGKLAWLRQIHSSIVLNHSEYDWDNINEGDALISTDKKIIPVVLTADCVPLVLANADGSAWAVIHAGWKGLHQNIISATIEKMPKTPIHAWFAPHIRQKNYEVDEAFYQHFMTLNPVFGSAFINNRSGHYLADLTKIAEIQLKNHHNIVEIADCGWDTFSDPRFHSYRRDKAQFGHLATFILPKG